VFPDISRNYPTIEDIDVTLRSWGRGVHMWMKDWFKPIFTLSITRLLRKLIFLIPTVDFAPQNVVSQVRPMREDEGCTLFPKVGKMHQW
jgi:hypothetical protein